MTDLHLHFPIFESRIVTMGKQSLLDRVLAIVDRGVHSFAALLDRLAAFAVRSLTTGLGAEEQRRRAAVLEQAQNEIAGVLIVSDFWGRHSVASKARAAGIETGGGSGPPPDEPDVTAEEDSPHEIRIEVLAGLDEELPKIPNAEAIADIVSREPRLAANWREVAKAYQDHAFALAGQSDLAVTKRVQQHIAEVLREGGTVDSAARRLSEIAGFSQAQAETVFRTNAATAFSSGAFRQAHDPETRHHFPAFEFSAVHDASTRPNHAAADGLIAPVESPLWNTFSPPLGYRCRCTIRLVSRGELESKGLLTADGAVRTYTPPKFARAHPDAGFGQGGVLTRFSGVPL